MMRDVLLALGLLLSTASQLRPDAAALGPGEVCLVIWLLLMLTSELGRLGPTLTPALSRLLLFWVMFVIALSVGTLAGFAIGDHHDPELFWHDAMAFPLLAAISCLMAVEPNARRRLHRVAWLLVAMGSVLLAAELAVAWGASEANDGLFDPWYWDRLRGFSENPNQLALRCAALAGLSLHLAEVAVRRRERILALGCAILPVFVGRLTKSDTFALALIVAGPLFVALKLRAWLLTDDRHAGTRSAGAWAMVLGLPVFCVAAAPFGYAIAFQVQDLGQQMFKQPGKDTEGEAVLRFESWKQAIDRGVRAGMLGLGPGPHIEIPAILVEARQREQDPRFVHHPTANGTANFEAHNTFLDLFTQGGLLATFSFIWLAGATVSGTIRAKRDGLTTLLGTLTVFSVFHLIVRHPLFWFAISLCLVMGTLPRQRPAVWAGS